MKRFPPILAQHPQAAVAQNRMVHLHVHVNLAQDVRQIEIEREVAANPLGGERRIGGVVLERPIGLADFQNRGPDEPVGPLVEERPAERLA